MRDNKKERKRKISFILSKSFDNYTYYIIYNRILRNPPRSVQKLSEQLEVCTETIIRMERKGLEKINSIGEEEIENTIVSPYERTAPREYEDYIILWYMKNKLKDPLEYFVMYYLEYSNDVEEHRISSLVDIVGMPYDEILKIVNSANEKVGNFISYRRQMKSAKKIILEEMTMKQLINSDFEPKYIPENENKKKIQYALRKYFDNYRYYIIYYGLLCKPPKSIDTLCKELNLKANEVRRIELEGTIRMLSLTKDDFVGYETCNRFTPMSLDEICVLDCIRSYLIDEKQRYLDYFVIYHTSVSRMDEEQIAALLNTILPEEVLKDRSITPREMLLKRHTARLRLENEVKDLYTRKLNERKNFLLSEHSLEEVMNINLEPLVPLNILDPEVQMNNKEY